MGRLILRAAFICANVKDANRDFNIFKSLRPENSSSPRRYRPFGTNTMGNFFELQIFRPFGTVIFVNQF